MPPDQPQTPESRMDLPPPVPPQEVAKAPETDTVKRQGTERNPEFLPPVGQSAQGPQQGPQPVHSQAPASSSTQPVDQTQHGAHQSSNPVLAEDVDLIEKEWVDKAKAIVNHTRDDPHRQNKEINKMKADYIKKRYNKDIQVSE